MTEANRSAEEFGGHPKGLYFLAFTEMWERFSFYGMTSLLTLYMVKQLLLPGHAENVAGLATLHQMFVFIRGPMTDLAFAALIYGLYSGLVYFTPILGGWIADRKLGANRTVIIGALLMSAGHLAMAFDVSFLLALVLLILGSGCLKGNISAQVGALYPAEAESLRSRGFTIFSTGINVGATAGPLVTGTVAAIFGWHAGFGVAAGLMLLALITYLAGLRFLPPSRPLGERRVQRAPLSAAERRRIWVLFAVIALTIPAEIAYPMVWSIGIVWVDQQVNLTSAFGTVPASWFNSVDSFGSILAAPVLIALWAWQARREAEPNSLGKMGIGMMLIALAALILAAGSALSPAPGHVGVAWALGGFLAMGLAWMYYWPTLLALVSHAAPRSVTGAMVGAAFISPFIAHTAAGWVGSFYDQMSPDLFWTMDAGIAVLGAALVFALRGPLGRALDEPLEADAASSASG
jgi:POT family proton-dependent oligopeptide transporter